MARAVIQGAGTRLPVEFMNPLDEDVILCKHPQVSVRTRLLDLSMISLRHTQISESTDLPGEVEVLMDKIEAYVNGEQRQQVFLRCLLEPHKGVLGSLLKVPLEPLSG